MIYTHLAAAVIAALAAWFFQDNRYTAELAELRLEHADAVIKATSTLRAEQHAITTIGSIEHPLQFEDIDKE